MAALLYARNFVCFCTLMAGVHQRQMYTRVKCTRWGQSVPMAAGVSVLAETFARLLSCSSQPSI